MKKKFIMYYVYEGQVVIEAEDEDKAVDILNEIPDEKLFEKASFELCSIAENSDAITEYGKE